MKAAVNVSVRSDPVKLSSDKQSVDDKLNGIQAWVAELRRTLAGLQARGVQDIRVALGSQDDGFIGTLSGWLETEI